MDKKQHDLFLKHAIDEKVLTVWGGDWYSVKKPRYFVHMMDGFNYGRVSNFIETYFEQKYEDFYNMYRKWDNNEKAIKKFVDWFENAKVNYDNNQSGNVFDDYYNYAMKYHKYKDDVIFVSLSMMMNIVLS